MRRWLLILLMTVLPLQAAWAVVGQCVCLDDERTHSAAAFDGASQESFEVEDDDSVVGHVDSHPESSDCNPQCSTCHPGGAQLPHAATFLPAPLALQRPVAATQAPLQSHIPDGLERPNWLFAA